MAADALSRDPESAKASETKDSAASIKKSDEPKVTLPYEDLDVGHVVDVKGRLATFREETQIEIVRLTTLRSTAQEMALWERRSKFQHQVLEKPWVLSEEQIRSCRKEAEWTEAEEDRAAKRKRRLKAAAAAASSRRVGKKSRRLDKESRVIGNITGVDS